MSIDLARVVVRQDISDQRTESNLSWLSEHQVHLQRWLLVQEIISQMPIHINTQGLERDAVHQLRAVLKPFHPDQTQGLLAKIIKFFLLHKCQFYLDERLPMS